MRSIEPFQQHNNISDPKFCATTRKIFTRVPSPQPPGFTRTAPTKTRRQFDSPGRCDRGYGRQAAPSRAQMEPRGRRAHDSTGEDHFPSRLPFKLPIRFRHPGFRSQLALPCARARGLAGGATPHNPRANRSARRRNARFPFAFGMGCFDTFAFAYRPPPPTPLHPVSTKTNSRPAAPLPRSCVMITPQTRGFCAHG